MRGREAVDVGLARRVLQQHEAPGQNEAVSAAGHAGCSRRSSVLATLLRVRSVRVYCAAARRGSQKTMQPRVAYFCMEFGLHEDLPIYAGGLGILAGDYMK